jgi:hypothetical protein
MIPANSSGENMVELAKPSRCGEQAQHIIDPINGTSRRSASIIANAAGEGCGLCGTAYNAISHGVGSVRIVR